MKHIITLTTIILLALAPVTVGADNFNLNQIDRDIDNGAAQIRFVHAAPYAGTVDVWNEKGVIAKSFAYGQASGYIKSTPELNSTIYLSIPGSDLILASFDLRGLDSGISYTAVVYNAVDGNSSQGIFRDLSVIVSADPEVNDDSGKTLIGAAHAARDVGTVQFRLDTDMISANPWASLDQGAFSGFVGVDTPNRVYIDADFDNSADITFTIPQLPANEYVYGAVVSETTGVYLLAVFSDGTVVKLAADTAPPAVEKSSVRILHLAPSAPAVDIYLNEETRAVSGLEYAQSVGYVELADGTYTVDIVPAGSRITDSVLATSLTLKPGVSYTVVAHETTGGLALQVTEDARAENDKILLTAQVRASHLIDILGPVNVYAVSPNDEEAALLIGKLTYGEPRGYLEIPAGQYTIGLDIDLDERYDVSFTLPFLFPGEVADLYAALNPLANPVIFTAVEDGELFISYANELKDVNPVY